MTGQRTGLRAFALLIGAVVGAGIALVEPPADPTGVPIVLLAGTVTVLAARARRSEKSPLGE